MNLREIKVLCLYQHAKIKPIAAWSCLPPGASIHHLVMVIVEKQHIVQKHSSSCRTIYLLAKPAMLLIDALRITTQALPAVRAQPPVPPGRRPRHRASRRCAWVLSRSRGDMG